MPNLTLEQMREVISKGASVMMTSGRVISSVSELPSVAELVEIEVQQAAEAAKKAGIDPAKQKAALDQALAAQGRQEQAANDLRAQLDKITADLARLQAGQPKAAEPVKAEPVKVTPGPSAVARASSPAMVPTKATEPEKAK